MAQYDVDLREYWRIIKKRKMIIILTAVVVAAGSYLFSKLKEPTPMYQADAAIKIEQQADLGFIRSTGFWVETESMDTHAYTLTSFPVLESTAVKLGWLPKKISDEDLRQNVKYLSVIEKLKNMVSTGINDRTNIITIKVLSRHADDAAKVANTIANSYREFYIAEKNQRTLDIKDFIENQLTVLSSKLEDAEKALREYREQHGIYSVDEKTKEIKNSLLSLQKESRDVVEQKTIVTSQLGRIEQGNYADMADGIAKQLTYSQKDSPLYGLGEKLDKLLSERQNLLSKYTEKHPAVLEVENQIQRIVIDAKSDLELYLKTLSERESTLHQQMAQLEGEARDLPEKEHELARLEMNASLQEKLYTELQTKHQEVLIQESGKIDSVTLVKPAIPPAEPYNVPSKMMISITGLILGLILGLVFGFGMEMFDTSMGTIEDVESSLQVPVLGVIPHLGGEEKGKKLSENQLSEIERARDLITHYDPKSLAAEAFRSLRTNLQFVRMEKKNKIFLVTSAFVKEGKTINVVNLGLSLAQAGEKVLLIEADLPESTT